MLAVHWTPVNSTKHILKNGISKSKNGVYCFPLTGHKTLDKWWVNFFNQSYARHRKSYNGIIFRITEDDLPAYFGSAIGATSRDKFEKPITSLSQLGREFREAIITRIGQSIYHERGSEYYYTWKHFQELGDEAIRTGVRRFIDYYNDLGFMENSLFECQIVLSNSIPSKRIKKIIPQGNEYGRVIRKRRNNKYDR